MRHPIGKRFCAWFCFLLLSLTLFACSSGEVSEESSVNTAVSSTEEESRADSSTANPESSEESVENSLEESSEEDAAASVSLPIYEIVTPFSNGVAWVSVRNEPDILSSSANGPLHTLIDTAGNIKLIFNSADWDSFYMYDDYLCLEKEGSLYFYNAEGELSFQLETTDTIKSYAVQGYGDGYWLIRREESGFSSRSAYLFSVDRKGNRSEKEYDITELVDMAGAANVQYFTFDYYGDGIFMRPTNASSDTTHLYYTYDALNGTLYYNGYLDLCAEFYEGVTLGRFVDSFERDYNNGFGVFPITSDQLREWLTVEYEGPVESSRSYEINAEVKAVIASGVDASTTYRVPYSQNYDAEDIASGILMIEDAENTLYYDFINETTFSLPVYEGDVRVESAGTFSGEYAKLVLRGADANYYLTIINRQGEAMYEPVMAEGADHLYGPCNWNGYIFDVNTGRYWSPDGEMHEDDKFQNISENLYWSTSLEFHVAYADGYGFYVDDDGEEEVIYIESWDGSEEIAAIQFTPDTVFAGSVSMISTN